MTRFERVLIHILVYQLNEYTVNFCKILHFWIVWNDKHGMRLVAILENGNYSFDCETNEFDASLI